MPVLRRKPWPAIALLVALAMAAPAAAQYRQPFVPAPAPTAAPAAQSAPARSAPPTAASLKLSPLARVRQAGARAALLAGRAATLPAHYPPGSRVARAIGHGEPLTGITPRSAVRAAVSGQRRGVATVIGRLAPTLRDVWSIRGAERSFVRLVDALHEARAESPELDASIAFDPHSFGIGLAGVSRETREATAASGMIRVATYARDHGVGVEIDMTELEEMPFTVEIARRIVTEVRVPVRLALAARYEASDRALDEWAALARETGLRLGVRLVKGSYVEPRASGAINARAPLLAHYRALITRALEQTDAIDVAVATQNEGIWSHTSREATRLGAPFSMHVIRGVNPELQARMRAAGHISREYVSFGPDGPIMGLEEMVANQRARQEIARQPGAPPIGDLD
jgi:hypothetical protein